MHPLLQKALQKLGYKSYNDLNYLEQETYKRWEDMLRGKKITDLDVVESIKVFMEEILVKLDNSNLSEKEKSYLLAQLSVVRLIVRTVESPKQDVKTVEDEVSRLP